MDFSGVVLQLFTAEQEAELADYFAKNSSTRPNEFAPTNPSVVNTVNVAITPPIPTAGNLQPTIEYAQAIAAESVANFGSQETPIVVTLLETLDDAGDLAAYLIRQVPAFWFGNIEVVMNGLTDAQRTTITNLDIGSQISVTKTFPKSTPSTVTQLMALEGISHDISPDRHIVTLYTNPARIYTYFIVGGYTTTTTRTNLVTNPSFEVNTTGWTGGTATISRDTTFFRSGGASLKVVSSTLGGHAVLTTRPTVVPGTQYFVSGYIYLSAGTLLMDIFSQWFNAAGGLISNDEGSPPNVEKTISAGSWQRFSTIYTAPANAASIQIFFRQLNSDGLTKTWYLDDVLFEQATTLLPYFDGTYADAYTGYTLTSQGWSGTANASTSTGTWGLTSSFVGSQLGDDTKGLG